jgi:lantibiotic modifying enzyme
MSRITEDPKYRSLAEKRAHWLLEQAEAHDDGLRWKGYKPFDAGFSHGAAGFAFFLEAAGQREGAKKAANWVESVAVPSGKESLLWRYYPGPPPEGKRNWTFNSWCHGAPGIVRLYLLMHARTGERRYLELALRAGGGVRESLGLDQGAPRYANPTYCCGAAGCLDAFLDLYGASGEKRWLNDARALADSIVKSLRGIEGSHVYATYDDSDQTTRKHPYVPTGFMHGNAGIGHALLRLALVIRGEEDRLVFLPDHPFAWKGK